jgi:hypothetical protein
MLAVVLIAWAMLALFAPGLGAMVAVFGSPFLACAVILRLLTLTPARGRRFGRGTLPVEQRAKGRGSAAGSEQ